jgi:uncharacterized RDD family membrane protein YckC
MAKLLVQESNGAREFELVDLEVNIGRELDNTLRLSDPSISRHHAVIRQGRDGYTIEDLQSSNGVLLNGARVPSAPLRDGDRITLGQMQLTFVDSPVAVLASDPLRTKAMDPETMAQIRATILEDAPAPFPAPAPAAPRLPATGKPGPAFLHPYLPDRPDPARPLLNPDGTVQRGDFLTRFQAALIDYSPLLALGILGLLLTSGFLAVFASLLALVDLALAVAYLILMPLYWMRCGATPGKKIMKLRVVPAGDPAGRLDLNGAILRLLGYLANGAIAWIVRDVLVRVCFPAGAFSRLALAGHFASWALTFFLLSLVTNVLPYLLLLRPERRGLQDLFSRSLVIKVDR